MNAVSHCCVKANFIKAAKDHWVPCEVRLLTDDTDTFLCIKSRPLGFGQTEEDIKSIFSGVSATGTISSTSNPTQLSSVTPVTRAFTALCNLSEYKSCTVVTVSINDVGYFALKLVPAGIFGNKRLYLAMSGETEATTWMSMIKANLGKRKKAAKNPLTQSRDSLVGTLRPSDSQDTLRGDSSANVNNRYDLDIDTIDNEVYEPCSAQDLIPAIIQQRGDWEKLRLSKMDCFLRLTDDRLELLDHNGERVLHWFPYLLIRRPDLNSEWISVVISHVSRSCNVRDAKNAVGEHSLLSGDHTAGLLLSVESVSRCSLNRTCTPPRRWFTWGRLASAAHAAEMVLMQPTHQTDETVSSPRFLLM
ncbi:hypothetical protein EGR_01520 [Echinococcus granulosus]|uniref:PH domain-containing protein n=1 Tax=Echinococcus granulosus TaxID=6210 RepID=W6UQF4_ECHGR|nr:hypothetical protein EGR_01520 [Echinococcus granulosus]EUB63438.1 hypothetical protein EGR_01520 [Echinococcus granulosus]